MSVVTEKKTEAVLITEDRILDLNGRISSLKFKKIDDTENLILIKRSGRWLKFKIRIFFVEFKHFNTGSKSIDLFPWLICFLLSFVCNS